MKDTIWWLKHDVRYYSEMIKNTEFCLKEDKEKLKLLKENLKNEKIHNRS